jgi:hypothetical protein
MAKIHSTEITLPLTDLEVKVNFTFTPGRPGKMYLRNGDPGYPDDPAEVELLEVIVGEDNIIDALSDKVVEMIEDNLLEVDWNEEN